MATTLERAEIVDRVARHAAAVSAAVRSTDPADRPRAELAMRMLYRVAGRDEPQIAWVDSPGAGYLAAGVAAAARPWIRGDFTRGDVGTGGNREWNALARPFDLEPAFRDRLELRVRDRVVRSGLGESGWVDLRRSLGIADIFGLESHVRAAAARRLADRRPADDSSWSGAGLSDDLASAVLGPVWKSIVEATGLDLGRELLAGSIRRAAHTIADGATDPREAERAMQSGQFDTMTPILVALRNCFGEDLALGAHRNTRTAKVDARLELARSAGPWWALDGLAVISERPLRLSVDDRGRPHAEDGPAMAWPDGMAVWSVHGVDVEPWVVTDPGSITIESMDQEQNSEIRRVLVERFGPERLVREGGSELVHEDETGRLWRRGFPRRNQWHRPEPVVMVEVLNSTPEPDGTRKTYFLRVPPEVQTAREAVAWTFGMDRARYTPSVQT